MSSAAKRANPIPGARRQWVLLVLLLAAVLAVGVWLAGPSRVRALFQQALEGTRQLGVWAPILFVALYIACCIALFPAAILTLGAGLAIIPERKKPA